MTVPCLAIGAGCPVAAELCCFHFVVEWLQVRQLMDSPSLNDWRPVLMSFQVSLHCIEAHE